VRERKEDLGLFVGELLARVAPERASELRLTIDLARAMYAYDWPLNLRELSHCLSTVAVFATDGKLHLRHAPEALRADKTRARPSGAPPAPGSRAAAKPPSDDDVRLRATLAEALARHHGNVSEIARELGRTRMQIHRWMRRFGMDAAAHRDPVVPRKP
jgi:DNA-binding NtrC family response regulator